MNYIWGAMILTGVIYGTLTGHIDTVSDAMLSSSKEAVTLCITMLGVMGLWMGLMEIAKDAGLIRTISRRIQPLIHFLFPKLPMDHPAAEHITTNMVANFLGLGWAATPAGLKAMESLAELEEERRAEAETERGTNTAQQMADAVQPSDRYQMGDERASARRKKNRHARRTAAERRVANAVQEPDRYRAEKGHMRKMKTAQRAAYEAQQTAETAQQAAGAKRRRKVPAVPRGVASNEMCTFLILNISSLQLIPVNVIAYRAQYGSVNPTAIVGPGIVATAVSTLAAVMFCKTMDKMQDSIRLDKMN